MNFEIGKIDSTLLVYHVYSIALLLYKTKRRYTFLLELWSSLTNAITLLSIIMEIVPSSFTDVTS